MGRESRDGRWRANESRLIIEREERKSRESYHGAWLGRTLHALTRLGRERFHGTQRTTTTSSYLVLIPEH